MKAPGTPMLSSHSNVMENSTCVAGVVREEMVETHFSKYATSPMGPGFGEVALMS